MYTEQCISVTDLRRKTGHFIWKDVNAEQFIFVGSKPTNVLLTMKRYEELRRIEENVYEQNLDFHFVPYNELSQKEQEAYDRAIQRDNNSFVNL